MNKTILITGSTDGIGKLAATKLAQAGHTVYLHGRNSEKLHTLIKDIKDQTGNNKVDGFVADFSSVDAAIKMGNEVLSKLSELDVLINNAGVFKTAETKNAQGLDLRLVVNYLVPYAFTNLVLPLLKNSNDGRVINLSSAAQAPVSLSALEGMQGLSQQEAYAQSKLALTMWTFDLASKTENVSVLAVNPGSLLNTNMVKEAYGSHWSSADKGADILFELASSDKYEGVTGQYFDNDKGEVKGAFGDAHPDAYDDSKIIALLETTDQILANKF